MKYFKSSGKHINVREKCPVCKDTLVIVGFFMHHSNTQSALYDCLSCKDKYIKRELHGNTIVELADSRMKDRLIKEYQITGIF